MKCLSVVALFGLIAVASAGIQRLDEVNEQSLRRSVRQTQFSSSSSTSSSSLQQPGQPVVFHQITSSYNTFVPPGGNAPNAGFAANANNAPNAQPGIFDRFSPDEPADNSSTANNARPGNAPTGNAQPGGVPYGNAQFPGAAPFGQPQFGNAPVYSGGHFSSVSGHYDPNTQQTVIYQNYSQKLK